MNGEPALKPELLAAAHGGVLYIDEINLLPDHLADAMLDAVASGVHVVEREGISARQDADFVLIGSMNPEEGTLRPQLLDRFALVVDVDRAARSGRTPHRRRSGVLLSIAIRRHSPRPGARIRRRWRGIVRRASGALEASPSTRRCSISSASRSAPTASARSARISPSSEPAARSRRSKASPRSRPITSHACFRWRCATASRTGHVCRKRHRRKSLRRMRPRTTARTTKPAARPTPMPASTAIAPAARTRTPMPMATPTPPATASARAMFRRTAMTQERMTTPRPSTGATRYLRQFRSPCRASSRPAVPRRPVQRPRCSCRPRPPRLSARGPAIGARRDGRAARAGCACDGRSRDRSHRIGASAALTTCTRLCGSRPAAGAICSRSTRADRRPRISGCVW